MPAETDNAGPILVRVHGVDREEIGESIRSALKAQDPKSALEQLSSDTRGSYAWLLSRHLKMLRHALRTLSRNHLVVLRLRVFWGEGSEAQKVAFLFPGQGSQYGHDAVTAEESPGVAEVFERGEKALKPLIHGSLKDIVWGDREDPNVAGRCGRRKSVSLPCLQQTSR